MITFANSLEPGQARQNVGPDLDPICLTLKWYSWSGSKSFDTLIVFLKEFLEKVDFEKNQGATKKYEKLPRNA